MSIKYISFVEILDNELLSASKRKTLEVSPKINAVLGSLPEETRENMIGNDLITDLLIGPPPNSAEIKGCTIMGTDSNGEDVTFGMKVRTLKSNINTLDRNLLSLEIRTGIQGPRDADGDPVPYTKATHNLWVDFLDAINLSYPEGILCDVRLHRTDQNLFPEQDALEKIRHRKTQGSLKDRMEARRKARKG